MPPGSPRSRAALFPGGGVAERPRAQARSHFPSDSEPPVPASDPLEPLARALRPAWNQDWFRMGRDRPTWNQSWSSASPEPSPETKVGLRRGLGRRRKPKLVFGEAGAVAGDQSWSLASPEPSPETKIGLWRGPGRRRRPKLVFEPPSRRLEPQKGFWAPLEPAVSEREGVVGEGRQASRSSPSAATSTGQWCSCSASSRVGCTVPCACSAGA